MCFLLNLLFVELTQQPAATLLLNLSSYDHDDQQHDHVISISIIMIMICIISIRMIIISKVSTSMTITSMTNMIIVLVGHLVTFRRT